MMPKYVPAAAFGALALVALGALVWAPAGHVSIDEVTQNLMLRSLAEDGTFTVRNGYEEYPSPELASEQVTIHGDHLAAQYPYFFPMAAAPLYGLLGFRAALLLNTLGFLVTAYATYGLARRVSADKLVPALAASLLVLTTYLGDYAHAAWPHATAVGLTTLSFLAMMRGLESRNGAALPCLLAGALVGLAAGMRLDATFVVPALVLPFVFRTSPRWREPALIALGTAPFFVLQAIINRRRFGTFSPFSYGTESATALTSSVVPYLKLAAAGAVLVGAAWLVTRPRGDTETSRVRGARMSWLVAGALVGIGLAVTLALGVAGVLSAKVRGIVGIAIDLRWLGHDLFKPAHVAAGMIYYGSVPKKALLQSCPLLVMAALPWVRAVRRRQAGDHRVVCLGLVPLLLITVFGSLNWHGGGGVNLRYLLACLPFLSVLAAMEIADLVPASEPHVPKALVLGALLTVGVYVAGNHLVAASRPSTDPPAACWMPAPAVIDKLRQIALTHLTFPLVLAGVLLGASLLRRCALSNRPAAAAVLALAVAAAVWGFIAGYLVDGTWARRRRMESAHVGATLAPLLSDDALVLVSPAPDPFFSVMQHRQNLRLALPRNDEFRDAVPLAVHHLRQGRRVFACLADDDWTKAEAVGLFADLSVHTLLRANQRLWGKPGYRLAELSRPLNKPLPAALTTPLAVHADGCGP